MSKSHPKSINRFKRKEKQRLVNKFSDVYFRVVNLYNYFCNSHITDFDSKYEIAEKKEYIFKKCNCLWLNYCSRTIKENSLVNPNPMAFFNEFKLFKV